MLKGKRILITGGAGFVGSSLVEKFYKDNEVIIIDNLSSGKLSNLPKDYNMDNFHEHTITTPIEYLFKDVEYVFHCAANVLVDESLEDPRYDAIVNVIGIVNVLEGCRKHGVKRMVWCASSAVYGNPDSNPIREDAKFKPDSPYAVSKTAGEFYCDLYRDLWNVDVVKLRYFNIYGPKQDVKNPYSGVIALFLNHALKDEQLTVSGNGNQTRDFVYIKDIVKANELAAEVDTSEFHTFNVGTGDETSILELAYIIRPNEPVKFGSPRPNEVMRDVADTTLARLVLSFNADYSLADGLAEYKEWRCTHEE